MFFCFFLTLAATVAETHNIDEIGQNTTVLWNHLETNSGWLSTRNIKQDDLKNTVNFLLFTRALSDKLVCPIIILTK